MLTRRQLEDAAKCGSLKCKDCSMGKDIEICVERTAETALALADMVERLEFADHSNIGGWKCCPICGTGINDRNHASDCKLAALLKGLEG